ncbi:MAG: hypothetical protein QW695_03350, partial [Candidatus Bathyarchaeia archaeon]
MLDYKLLIAVSLAIAVLGAAFAIYFRYNLLSNEYDRLRIDYTSLLNDYRRLEDRFNELSYRYMQLNDSYMQLNSSYMDILLEYNVLEDLYGELERSYIELQSGYNDLMSEYMVLRHMYNKLNDTYSILEKRYENIVREYYALQKSFDELNVSYTSIRLQYYQLRSSYDKLLESYDMLKARYANLSRNYDNWRRYMLSYLSLQESIPRVLSSDEIGELAWIVRALITYPSDYWSSIREIYLYVKSHVEYAYDPPIPYPPTAIMLEEGGYRLETYSRVVLSPIETLKRGYGDSEDQTILLYALIKAYERYVHGREYVTWILNITLSDGGSHMSIAIPAQGGRIAIIDPAKGYYTGYPSSLKPLDPYTELINYSSLFIYREGIKHITIYMIRSGYLTK